MVLIIRGGPGEMEEWRKGKISRARCRGTVLIYGSNIKTEHAHKKQNPLAISLSHAPHGTGHGAPVVADSSRAADSTARSLDVPAYA